LRRIFLRGNFKRQQKSGSAEEPPFFLKLKQKSLGSNQLVSLRFFAGSTVGRDHADFGGLVKTADEVAAELISLSITGFNSGTQFLFKGLQFAESGTVAQISFGAGPQTLGSLF
jgi:hypothetical protein